MKKTRRPSVKRSRRDRRCPAGIHWRAWTLILAALMIRGQS